MHDVFLWPYRLHLLSELSDIHEYIFMEQVTMKTNFLKQQSSNCIMLSN